MPIQAGRLNGEQESRVIIMSWNGSIPARCTKSKGVRNKRNKKSTKAIQAKAAKALKRASAMRFEKHGGGGGGRDDYSRFDQ